MAGPITERIKSLITQSSTKKVDVRQPLTELQLPQPTVQTELLAGQGAQPAVAPPEEVAVPPLNETSINPSKVNQPLIDNMVATNYEHGITG